MARKNPIKESLIVVFASLALLASYVWLVRPYLEKKKNSADQSQMLFANTSKEKLTELHIERGTETYHLKKLATDNSKWNIGSSEGPSYETDSGVVEGFFATLLGSKLEKKLDTHPDLNTLGLAQPKIKLSMKGDGVLEGRQLLIGNDTPVDYFSYAKWSDNPDIILVSRSLRFALDKGITDWRSRKVINIALDQLNKFDIKVSRLEKHPATFLSFSFADNVWKSTGSNIRLDSTELKNFAEKLSSIQVSNFTSQNPNDKNKYGFQNPIASFVFTSKDTGAEAVRWVLSSAYDSASKSNKYYLMNQSSPETYEVPEVTRDYFRIDLMKFRNKKIYFPSASQIYGLKIHSEKESSKLIKKDGRWFVKGGEEGDEALVSAKGAEVDKLVQKIQDLQVLEYFDGQTPYTLGLQNPSRILEVSSLTEGKEVVMATLFFGKKRDTQATTVRGEGMEAAARIDLKIEETLQAAKSFWSEKPLETPAAPSLQNTSSSSQISLENAALQVEKKKMKLEATVKSINELKKLPSAIVKKGFKYTAEMTLNNGKKIVITFAPDKAPYTVSNFLHLARNGFYNNVSFHRVIAKFVVQGGDPTGRGSGGPGWMFDNEDNDLKHVKGAISMAHAGRNTNGSQFFLVLEPQPHLDGVHTVFGQVTQGIDVMESIKQGDTMKSVEVFEEAL